MKLRWFFNSMYIYDTDRLACFICPQTFAKNVGRKRINHHPLLLKQDNGSQSLTELELLTFR